MRIRNFIIILTAWTNLACDPFHTEFDSIENAKLYSASTISSADDNSGPLTIMTWNIKFGGGRLDFFFDCHGDEVLMTKQQTVNHLQAIATLVNDIAPDILFLQEIDVSSKRSAYVNQVQWILDNTELNYAAYASQWKADFVPSDGVGRVNSGNAILSRWPISNAKRIALPEISSQDALTRYFYLKRNYIKAEVTPAVNRTLHLLNVHTDAFAQDDTTKQQLDILLEELKRIDNTGNLFVAGGDFNTLPPNSTQTNNFSDSVCTDEDFQADDFSEKTDWLDEFYNTFIPAVSLADYTADNTPYFTHSVDADVFWNRKLDYLFTNSNFIPDSTRVYQDIDNGGYETMPLSDHAPISTQWSFP